MGSNQPTTPCIARDRRHFGCQPHELTEKYRGSLEALRDTLRRPPLCQADVVVRRKHAGSLEALRVARPKAVDLGFINYDFTYSTTRAVRQAPPASRKGNPMKAFLGTRLGKAVVALCLGLMMIAWPPSLAWLVASAALTYFCVTIRRLHRRTQAPLTLTYKSRHHDAGTAEPASTWTLAVVLAYLVMLNAGMLALLAEPPVVFDLVMGVMVLAAGAVLSWHTEPWRWFERKG